MDRVAVEQTALTLAEITAVEVERYAGTSPFAKYYALLDEKRQRYTVIEIEDERTDESVCVTVMARVVDDFIVIEEDTFFDKPLYEALMVNGGVPRDKIILAYKGEKLPESP